MHQGCGIWNIPLLCISQSFSFKKSLVCKNFPSNYLLVGDCTSQVDFHNVIVENVLDNIIIIIIWMNGVCIVYNHNAHHPHM